MGRHEDSDIVLFRQTHYEFQRLALSGVSPRVGSSRTVRGPVDQARATSACVHPAGKFLNEIIFSFV